MEKEGTRINKYLALRGKWSRREIDHMIEEGRINVNGKKAMAGMKVSEADTFSLDGKPIFNTITAKKVVLAFNKPRGIVCTSSQKDRAQNIIDFIGYKDRIFPIGRLDKDSEGLILLTNRGELVNLVNKSSGAHGKEYLVKCKFPLTENFLKNMASGVKIEVPLHSGFKFVKTRKCHVKRKDSFSFYITLCEGYNRQIRRMCEALSNNAQTIKRVRIMNIRLGLLKEGSYRLVLGDELKEFEKELGFKN